MIQPKLKFIFDRKKVSSKNHKGVIELRIYYKGVQKFISTGFSVYPNEWSDREGVKGIPEAFEINVNLSELKRKALKLINEMLEEGSFDIYTMSDRLRGKSADMTFLQYVSKRMADRNVRFNTMKSYRTFYAKLEEYGKIVTFADLTQNKIMAWDKWLHNYSWTEKDKRMQDVKRSYSQATIGSFHKNLKAFIADAVVDGYLNVNPYVSFRIKIDKGGTRIDKFLTPDEIKAVEKVKAVSAAMQHTKDLFLIQVYTGLGYADLMTFDFTKCKGADDYAVFSDYRVKTGILYTFVLTPKAKTILEKYDYILPVYSNQQYNQRLKVLGDDAKVTTSLTSHVGRRSCGYFLLNAGVPMAVVSRILGHSSISQTEKSYARLLDDTIADEIKKHVRD